MLGLTRSLGSRALCTPHAVRASITSCPRLGGPLQIHCVFARTARQAIDTRLVPRRTFQHLAPKSDVPPAVPGPSGRPKTDENVAEPNAKEQRKIDLGIVKRLMVNVWPKNDWKTRGTVLLGFALLIGGKVCPARCSDHAFALITWFSTGSQCPSSFNFQEHHRLAQSRYHCTLYSLGSRWKFNRRL